MKPVVVGYKLFFAGISIAALTCQLLLILSYGTRGAINFVSMFTTDTNFIGAAALFLGVIKPNSADRPKYISSVRGASVVYLLTTAIVYALVLCGLPVWLHVRFISFNFLQHYLFPLIVLVDWLIDPPNEKVDWRIALYWLIFPLCWLAYTLLRGVKTGWYPYAFVNPSMVGSVRVVTICMVITVFVVLLSLLIARLGSRRSSLVVR
jgi:hypothetical protein